MLVLVNPAYAKALKEASFAELFRARQKRCGRRNLTLAVGLVAFVVIVWVRWNLWTLVVPALILFAAVGQHWHLKPIHREMKERKQKSYR